MGKRNNLGRRKFLKGSLLGLGLSALEFESILNVISKGIISDLMASERGDNNLNYVGIQMHGGPQRWIWDLPLHVLEGNNNLSYNPCVITKFNPNGQGVNDLGTYDCVDIGGIKLPSMWSSSVHTIGGQTPMAELTNNSLFIRGVVYPNGAHEGRWHSVIPFFGAPGIHTFPQGQAGNNRPVDCVQMALNPAACYPYKPKKNGSSVNLKFIPEENPVEKLLSPFKFARDTLHSPDQFNNNLPRGFGAGGENLMRQKIDEALDRLEIVAKKINQSSEKLFIDHRRAKQQFSIAMDAFIQEYNRRYENYRTVISANINSSTINGVEGVHTARGGDLAPLYRYNKNDSIPVGHSLDELFINNASIDSMAGSMALIEVLLENRLTSSIVMGISSMEGMLIPDVGRRRLNNDSHFLGSALALVGFTKFYKCLSGCLLSLRAKLIGDNLWNKTILHIQGDFNRSPRTDGSGTDHGAAGSNTTIMSGLINGAKVIGGTYVNTPRDLYYDWGVAAPYNRGGFADEPFTNHHIESSFASVFNATSSVRVPTLFSLSNNQINLNPDVINSAQNIPYPNDEES